MKSYFNDLEQLEKLIFNIGFNKIITFDVDGIHHYKYKDYLINIEIRYKDYYNSYVIFELIKLELFTQNFYYDIRKELYLLNNYKEDMDNFNNDCKELLSSIFKADIRKYKIKNLLN